MNSKSVRILFAVFAAMSLLFLVITCEEPNNELAVVSLNVTPPTILTGETSHIEAQVRNDTDQMKTFEVPVMVNGVAQDRKSITLTPGETGKVGFSVRRDKAGTYTIRIGSQDSTLEVSDLPPKGIPLVKLELPVF